MNRTMVWTKKLAQLILAGKMIKGSVLGGLRATKKGSSTLSPMAEDLAGDFVIAAAGGAVEALRNTAPASKAVKPDKWAVERVILRAWFIDKIEQVFK